MATDNHLFRTYEYTVLVCTMLMTQNTIHSVVRHLFTTFVYNSKQLSRSGSDWRTVQCAQQTTTD